MKKIFTGIALIAIIPIAYAFFLFEVIPAEGKIDNNLTLLLTLAISAAGSAVILWLWMTTDYLTNKQKLRHKGLWGWSLFLGNWLAAIIYFFTIYVPRNMAEIRGSRRRIH